VTSPIRTSPQERRAILSLHDATACHVSRPPAEGRQRGSGLAYESRDSATSYIQLYNVGPLGQADRVKGGAGMTRACLSPRPACWTPRLLRVISLLTLMVLAWGGMPASVPPRAHADPPLPLPPPSPTVMYVPSVPAYQPAAFARRDYLLHIQRDGSVQVTEHWELTFSGVPVSERDGAVNLSLALDQTTGIDFVQAEGADPGTSSLYSGSPGASSHADATWLFNSRKSPAASSPPTNWKTFDIRYVIQGALNINAPQAWFDWQFLDGGSTETNIPVAESTISITLPERTPARELRATATDRDHPPVVSYVHGDTVVATATGLEATHPFEVEVIFPRGELTPGVDSLAGQDSSSPPRLPSAVGHPREEVRFRPVFYSCCGTTIDAPPGPGPAVLNWVWFALALTALGMFGLLALPLAMSALQRRVLLWRGTYPRRSRQRPPDSSADG
jgi:hypothetical protein